MHSKDSNAALWMKWEKGQTAFPPRKKSPSITPQICIHIQDRCACVKNMYVYPHVLEVLEQHWFCAEFRAKPKLRFQGTEILPAVFSKWWLQTLKISWDKLFFWAFLHHVLYENELQQIRGLFVLQSVQIYSIDKDQKFCVLALRSCILSIADWSKMLFLRILI